MTRAEKQLIKARKEYKLALEKAKQEREAKAKAKKTPKKRGRKPISAELLNDIEKAAYKMPLTDVVLKFDVSLRSLYNHGISRRALIEKAKAA